MTSDGKFRHTAVAAGDNKALTRLKGKGDMECNLCGGMEFGRQGAREGVRCTQCGSLERTRLMLMHLQRTSITAASRILHVAPEFGLHQWLRQRVNAENYHVVDMYPESYPNIPNIAELDLCSLEDQPTAFYDLILHSHVLEHTPCNIAYTLFHLHRMLKPSGTHLFVVPFLGGHWDECFADIGDEERIRRFGQTDHIRRFGKQDVDKHLGKLIPLPADYDASREFPVDDLRAANVPETCWRGLTPNTVIELRKQDFCFAEGVRGHKID